MREFKDYERIVKGLAYRFAPALKEEPEDLFQEAFIHFVEVCIEEKTKGLSCEFEAAFYTHLKQEWLTAIQGKNRMKRKAEEISLSNIEELLGRNPYHNLDEFLSLPKELQEVVEIIWSAPKELMDLLKYGESFRAAMSKYLKRKRGWSNLEIEQLWTAFSGNAVVQVRE